MNYAYANATAGETSKHMHRRLMANQPSLAEKFIGGEWGRREAGGQRITFGAVYCRWPLSVVVVSGSEQAADRDIGHAVWRLSRLASAAT